MFLPVDKGKTLAGIGFGLGAYGIWGFFPLFFRQLGHVAPLDLLCNRAVWGCVFVSLVLTARRHWASTLAAARRPGTLWRLTLAALLVGANWLAFLWAVDQHQVVASSLGYFLTPLVNVLLGMLVLKERLNAKEWGSVALAVAAVGNEFFTLGSLPWISLFLGTSFGLYGLVRKQVAVDAISGLWLETLSLMPLLGAYTLWQAAHGHGVLTGFDGITQALLAAAGALTALPLMLFAAATQRLNLATVGMLMYINPTLQFLTAVLIFDEPLQPARLGTFALIWAGLLLYSWSGWTKYRQARPA
ncbi:EamA family transporter RarD [Zoogloea sp.]|uniref:EamA family transporter RarD n=1 Tax=Zoogloea sp. TaxID=49181 RepID=UPI0035B45DE7